MPGGDGTGPMGMGPMTGRAAGYCAGYPMPGFMNAIPGRGIGGRGPGAFYGGWPMGRAMMPYGPMSAPYAAGWGRGISPAYGWGGFRGRGLGMRLGLGWRGGFGRGRGRGFRRW